MTKSELLMFIVTSINAVLTFLICIFNYKSAKATREQVAESQRQFEENNRPYINIIFEVIDGGLACLTISNNGNKIAKHLNIKINEEFLGLLEEDQLKQIRKFNSKEIVLGINQKLTLCMGSHIELNKLSQEDINLNISYTDGYKQFEEKTTINLAGYLGMLLFKNYHKEMDKSLKNISSTLGNINSNFKNYIKEEVASDMHIRPKELDKNVQGIKEEN